VEERECGSRRLFSTHFLRALMHIIFNYVEHFVLKGSQEITMKKDFHFIISFFLILPFHYVEISMEIEWNSHRVLNIMERVRKKSIAGTVYWFLVVPGIPHFIFVSYTI
jgi:hypothetical protein